MKTVKTYWLDASMFERYFARMFDLLWLNLLVIGTLMFWWEPADVEVEEAMLNPGMMLMFAVMVTPPVTLLMEWGLYCVFGGTPGKALLGMRVMGPRGEKLERKEYLKRNGLMLVKGFGLCVPVVSLVTQVRQARRVETDRQASYDEGAGWRVKTSGYGWGQRLLFIGGLLGMLVLYRHWGEILQM